LKAKSKLIVADFRQCSACAQIDVIFLGCLKAALRNLKSCRLQRARIIIWIDKVLGSRARLNVWRIQSINPMKASCAADGSLKFNGRCGQRGIER
jgi:hypothetical protein